MEQRNDMEARIDRAIEPEGATPAGAQPREAPAPSPGTGNLSWHRRRAKLLPAVRNGGEVGMTDREKVIRGLECCVIHVNCAADDGCPYRSKADANCLDTAIKDALALLKAQEPRVVKISELTSGEPMLVWLEDIDKDETVAGMIFDYVPGRFGFKLTDIGSMDRIYPLIEEYLTRWRCWTSRPTDEQREEVKWK